MTVNKVTWRFRTLNELRENLFVNLNLRFHWHQHQPPPIAGAITGLEMHMHFEFQVCFFLLFTFFFLLLTIIYRLHGLAAREAGVTTVLFLQWWRQWAHVPCHHCRWMEKSPSLPTAMTTSTRKGPRDINVSWAMETTNMNWARDVFASQALGMFFILILVLLTIAYN